MALTYGFYNSVEGDRKYDAIQVGQIFDGIIKDGIYATFLKAMVPKASTNASEIIVQPGRAWFDHTWTYIDADYPVEAPAPEVILDRIDALVLDVNRENAARENKIMWVQGTPASQNPQRPTLYKDITHNQYALAYVRRKAGTTMIYAEDITVVVGTSETPFVTGVLEAINVDDWFNQWDDEFHRWENATKADFDTWESDNKGQFIAWRTEEMDSFDTWRTNQVTAYNSWFAAIEAQELADKADWDAWYANLQNELHNLPADSAEYLQLQIDDIKDNGLSGSYIKVTTVNSSLQGKTVTIANADSSIVKTTEFDSSLSCEVSGYTGVGPITISSTDGIQTATSTVNIPYFGRFNYTIAFWAATVNIIGDEELAGFSVTVKDSEGTTVDTIVLDTYSRGAFSATYPDTYTFSVTYEGDLITEEVDVTSEMTYSVSLSIWKATVNLSTNDEELYNTLVTIKDSDNQTMGQVRLSATTGEAVWYAKKPDTYTFNYIYGGNDMSVELNVTEETTYSVEIYGGPPEGATVTPVNDVSLWIRCAGLDSELSYTTLDEVLADEEALWNLISDSNACDYLARCTDWATNPGLVPTMTSTTAPSGTVIFSSQFTNDGYYAWKAFDKSTSTRWAATSLTNEYVGYAFESPVIVNKASIRVSYENNVTRLKNYLIQASNDNSNWDTLYTGVIQNTGAADTETAIFNNSTEYLYYRLYGIDNYTSTSGFNISIIELQFYAKSISIPEDSTAMRLIGMCDYASDKLLSNSIWCNAICNSSYFESVLNVKVPVMTSNTAPSGTASATVSSYQEPYRAFNGSSSDGWTPGSGVNSGTVYYVFPTDIVVHRAEFKYTIASGSPKTITAKIVGSNDGNTWDDISSASTVAAGGSANFTISDNSLAYSYIGMNYSGGIIYTSGSYRGQISVLQFYGRKPASQTGKIHSAANDTIYYTSGNAQITVCTTDSNGVGEVDYSDLPRGEVTLYSSVAKDPENLANDYSKTINNSHYKVEEWLVPALGTTLYWYGVKSDLLVQLDSTWSRTTSRTMKTVTLNTNSATTSSETSNQSALVTSDKISDVTNVYGIGKLDTATSNNHVSGVISASSKTLVESNYNPGSTVAKMGSWRSTSTTEPQYLSCSAISSSCYIGFTHDNTGNAHTCTFYALWFE